MRYRTPTPRLSQAPAPLVRPGPVALQRAAVEHAPLADVLPGVRDAPRSPGQPLDADLRAELEPRFGHDFSRVRVHTDARAAQSARAVNALAYAIGRDIVFGAGQYAPSTHQGQQLLAHELAHVVQQATTRPRLQRQPKSEPPTLSEAEAEEDVRKERERFEAARTTHQERLKEAREREQPHALRTASVTGQTRAGASAATLIQAALAESRLLRPYLQSRLGSNEKQGQIRITDGRFQQHDTLDDFASAWATYTGRPATPVTDALRNEAAGVGGFYDRARKKIHLNPKATLGQALHEAIHKVSLRAIESLFGNFLNEGVTQYFTDAVLAEQGLGPATGHRYGPQLACAQTFVSLFGRDDVARVMFSGAGSGELVARVRQRLNITEQERVRLAQQDQFCQRLPSAPSPTRPAANPPLRAGGSP